jgi:hypothetical protein
MLPEGKIDASVARSMLTDGESLRTLGGAAVHRCDKGRKIDSGFGRWGSR